MDPNNPDFIIQPSNKEGVQGPPTNAQPQHTITLTLTSPGTGPGMHGGPSSGVPTSSLIVSGPAGLGMSQVTSAAHPGHHYGGASISATPLQSNIQAKQGAGTNYVMTGGQPLLVSGPSMIHPQSLGPSHHERTALYGPPTIQSNIQKSNVPQSYVMSSGPVQGGSGHDSGDESHPVSIHVSNNAMQSHDSGPPSAESHSSGQTEQRLKVEDALNYLDQVKYKFGNQPQVYNDFLDIMKEFKSQSIDTPGVISRVSNLFRGHPELIVGFNTFLPPGYKIEVQTHDQGSQISYRVDGVTSYVVTNVPSFPSAAPAVHVPVPTPANAAPQIIQHTTAPVVPIRSISSHPVHAVTQPPYNSGVIASGIAGGINNGSISPPPQVNLAPSSYDSLEASSAFTHSFSSPFVQNAFPSSQTQPVQFNQAINYVNKIKSRFGSTPEKYKQFLDILHHYQKEQKNIKEGIPSKDPSFEHQVYTRVAKIFENQDDLLAEFGQFLPESNSAVMEMKPLEQPKKPVKVAPREYATQAPLPIRPPHSQAAPKRATAALTHAVTKKPKIVASYKDISIAEASRYGTLHEYAYFDKVRAMLKHQKVFENFLRCLHLFNEEIVSRSELLSLIQPFFAKNPEMFSWFKEFVNRKDELHAYEPVSASIMKQERAPEEQALEIGEEYFSTCKRLGASYCALPKNHVPPSSSGRSALCKEVLNDFWVSFPTWSEDSTFVTSRKTQFEEYICRCEDERFELDVIIEANSDTIRTLEAVARKMARMSQDELAKFQLNDKLGGTSETIHQRAIRRVYGEKAGDIIHGVKVQPYMAIPIVLKRLKMKEEEWRESQRNFNKLWRDQVERFYLKSLDHQGITFKQSDIRMLRSKALINEIETIYDERHDQENVESDQPIFNGPHMTFQYADRAVVDDACNLLLHHVRRQSSIQNEDKRKIKQLLKHFIPDLLRHTRMELSDDENEPGSNEDHDDVSRKSPTDHLQNGSKNGTKRASAKRGGNRNKKDDDDEKEPDVKRTKSSESVESRRTVYKRELKVKLVEINRARMRSESTGNAGGIGARANRDQNKITTEKSADEVPYRVIQVPNDDDEESYTLFFINNAWYVFLRLHHILCERLGRMLDTAAKLLAEETKTTSDTKTPPAVALRMRQINDVEISEYYPTFLEMVKNLLDGNMEASAYEDTMREMFGIHAYISYTMDKVVTNAVRQLQTLVADDVCLKFTDLFLQSQKKGGTGGLCATAEDRAGFEITYQKQSEKIDPEENCYKTILYHKSFRMTIELLEGANIEEDVVETTRWSSYVDSFTTQPQTGMDIKVKDRIKPVFLNRSVVAGQELYARKGYPPECAKELGIRQEFEDDNSEHGSDKSKRSKLEGSKFMLSQTLAPVTPEEAEELEKQLERNSKRRSELVLKEAESAVIFSETSPIAQAKSYLATNNPVTPEEAERLEKQLEANAKRRAEIGTATKSPFVIRENLQCKFNPNSFKMTYVSNSENYFYIRGSFKKAKASHKKVSKKMNEKFGLFHQIWLEKHVTAEQLFQCGDWLMEYNTKILSTNDINLPPYRPFNKYLNKALV